MLDIMRKYKGSMGAKIVLGLLALSFIGGFGLLSQYEADDVSDATIVAEVNGKRITQRELDTLYRRQVDRYRSILKDQFDEALLKKLNLRWQALGQRINNLVVMDEAKRLGLTVSDQELADTLHDFKSFQDENGEFRASIYKKALENQRPALNPAQFEKEQRDYMLVRKMEDYVHNTVFVTDEEVLQQYIRKNQTVDLSFIAFTADAMRSSRPVSDTAVRRFYDENQDKFGSGKRVMLETLRISPMRLASKVAVTDNEIKEYYDGHKAEFAIKDEQVKASHILIRVDEGAPADAVREAEKKMEAIKKKALAGEDFAELAKVNSQDGSASKGGDLGWFGHGQMVKPFDEAAFGAELGKIVGPVRTQFGYHLIRVEEKHGAGEQALEAVKPDIRRKLEAEQGKKLATDAKARADQMIGSGTPLTDVAKSLGEEVTATKEEVGEQGFARIKYPKEIIDDILGDKFPPAGKWTSYQGVEYFMRIAEKLEPALQPFEKVRPRIEAVLQQEDKMTQAAEAALEALKDVQAGTDLAKVAKKHGLEVEETGPFTVEAEDIPKIGKSEEILKNAFTLTKDNPYTKTTLRVAEKFYVVKLKDRSELKFDDFDARRVELRDELLKDRRNDLWQNWLREVKARSKVDIKNAPLPEEAAAKEGA